MLQQNILNRRTKDKRGRPRPRPNHRTQLEQERLDKHKKVNAASIASSNGYGFSTANAGPNKVESAAKGSKGTNTSSKLQSWESLKGSSNKYYHDSYGNLVKREKNVNGVKLNNSNSGTSSLGYGYSMSGVSGERATAKAKGSKASKALSNFNHRDSGCVSDKEYYRKNGKLYQRDKRLSYNKNNKNESLALGLGDSIAGTYTDSDRATGFGSGSHGALNKNRFNTEESSSLTDNIFGYDVHSGRTFGSSHDHHKNHRGHGGSSGKANGKGKVMGSTGKGGSKIKAVGDNTLSNVTWNLDSHQKHNKDKYQNQTNNRDHFVKSAKNAKKIS